jgi:hypothetical protein
MNWDELLNAVAAAGALGAAAFGLVDVTKGWWISIQNSGFRFITDALMPFAPALQKAVGENAKWTDLLWAHWLNGRDNAQQKAIAKSLIRLGLDPETALSVAPIVNVDAQKFAATVQALQQGDDLAPTQINLLGRFDAAVDARLDAAYERADRRYRTVARNLAAFYAVVLAVVAGCFLLGTDKTSLVKAVLLGLVAVPLAPMTKDLVTGLRAAMDAVKSTKA